jgi:DNA (cytosine-5)-methyltransferase 1
MGNGELRHEPWRTLTNASFFSGVGGMDLGFERAGIKTVSFSEIEPYQSEVLARNWPGVPNLGDIVALADSELSKQVQQTTNEVQRRGGHTDDQCGTSGCSKWQHADIFSGGFPCQDLSAAGARRGFEGERSVLAFTYLDLVELYRPAWLVLENVPGLLHSSGGRDFARLISEMEELGYGVAWRVLDAQYFGVPQRRRRVFIVASLGSDRAGEVLFECEGGCRHTAQDAQEEARAEAAAHVDRRTVSNLNASKSGWRIGAEDAAGGHLILGTEDDASGMRASDGVAGRVDSQPPVAGETPLYGAEIGLYDDSTDGLDTKRYTCCGNGVVSSVAEWVARRIVACQE